VQLHGGILEIERSYRMKNYEFEIGKKIVLKNIDKYLNTLSKNMKEFSLKNDLKTFEKQKISGTIINIMSKINMITVEIKGFEYTIPSYCCILIETNLNKLFFIFFNAACDLAETSSRNISIAAKNISEIHKVLISEKKP